MAARTKGAAKSARGSGAKKAQPKKSAAKAAVAKKPTAKRSPAKATSRRSASAKKAPAKKAPAKAATKKAPAKKAPAKKAPAKKAPAKKAPASKAPKKAAPPPHRSRSFTAQADVKKAPPKRKGPLDKFLLGQLAALQEERAIYARQAESLRAEADLLAAEREPGDVQFDEESGEGDTLAVERERDLTLSAQAIAAVEEIDRAIAKLDEGTYGVCEVCNSSIPKERLRALPYAALCVQCKSAGFSRR